METVSQKTNSTRKDGIRILLVLANSFMDNLIPLGVSIMSACFKQAGHEVGLFDTTFYKTREKTGDEGRIETLQLKETNLGDIGVFPRETDIISDFKAKINEFKPDLIGVSVVETTYSIGLDLLRAIRGSGIPTIMGGIHVTFSPEEVIKEPSVDMVCVGEGERAMVELANRLRDGKDYTDIPNLWVKKEGKIYKNPVGPLVHLDELPEQDWTIYEKERFFKPMGGKIHIAGAFEINRGCPYFCAFCCNKGLRDIYKGYGSYYREKNMDIAMREMMRKKEQYNLQYIYVVAENFLLMSDVRFNKFIEHYKKIRLPFWVQSRAESVTEDRLSRLEEVGCEGLSIGVECGNEKFRKEVLKRNVTNEAMIKAFEAAKKTRIRICANNIIGFPTETRNLIFETIELNRNLRPDNIIVNVFSPYRGTELRQLCIEKGYLDSNAIAGDYRCDAAVKMPHLTPEQIRGLHRTFVMYARLPKKMWPEIERCENFDKGGNETFKRLKKIYFQKYA